MLLLLVNSWPPVKIGAKLKERVFFTNYFFLRSPRPRIRNHTLQANFTVRNCMHQYKDKQAPVRLNDLP